MRIYNDDKANVNDNDKGNAIENGNHNDTDEDKDNAIKKDDHKSNDIQWQ